MDDVDCTIRDNNSTTFWKFILRETKIFNTPYVTSLASVFSRDVVYRLSSRLYIAATWIVKEGTLMMLKIVQFCSTLGAVLSWVQPPYSFPRVVISAMLAPLHGAICFFLPDQLAYVARPFLPIVVGYLCRRLHFEVMIRTLDVAKYEDDCRPEVDLPRRTENQRLFDAFGGERTDREDENVVKEYADSDVGDNDAFIDDIFRRSHVFSSFDHEEASDEVEEKDTATTSEGLSLGELRAARLRRFE